jgi:hypothetical protein
VSSIVTTIIIVIGVILIVPLAPVLQAPALQPAFAQMIPALFGAWGGYSSRKMEDCRGPRYFNVDPFYRRARAQCQHGRHMDPVAYYSPGRDRLMYKKGCLKKRRAQIGSVSTHYAYRRKQMIISISSSRLSTVFCRVLIRAALFKPPSEKARNPRGRNLTETPPFLPAEHVRCRHGFLSDPSPGGRRGILRNSSTSSGTLPEVFGYVR